MIVNLHFNTSNSGDDHLRDDARWRHGTPIAGNTNYAWVSQIVRLWADSEILAARGTRRLGVA